MTSSLQSFKNMERLYQNQASFSNHPSSLKKNEYRSPISNHSYDDATSAQTTNLTNIGNYDYYLSEQRASSPNFCQIEENKQVYSPDPYLQFVPYNSNHNRAESYNNLLTKNAFTLEQNTRKKMNTSGKKRRKYKKESQSPRVWTNAPSPQDAAFSPQYQNKKKDIVVN